MNEAAAVFIHFQSEFNVFLNATWWERCLLVSTSLANQIAPQLKLNAACFSLVT
jgi:hypothetical protein